MTKKTQMEITNTMFMHLIGFIGIMAFTFLFISLMTGSQSRASGLKEESLFQNYARRLISSSDCLAFQYIESYYAADSSNIYYYSKTEPGIIDMSNFFDFNHQNCIRYDLASGAINNEPKKSDQVFPVILYEVKATDIDNDVSFEFSNTLFQSKGLAKYIDICRPKQGGYPDVCLLDCDELRNYLASPLAKKEEFSEDDLPNVEKYYTSTSLEGVALNVLPTYPHPGVNCWEESFRDSLRAVVPYKSLKCSDFNTGDSYEFGFGNVLETSSQYFVKLRYELKDKSIVENDGIIEIKFCVINIPTMCDPAYENTLITTKVSQFLSSLGYGESTYVYQKEICEELGLPLI